MISQCSTPVVYPSLAPIQARIFPFPLLRSASAASNGLLNSCAWPAPSLLALASASTQALFTAADSPHGPTPGSIILHFSYEQELKTYRQDQLGQLGSRRRVQHKRSTTLGKQYAWHHRHSSRLLSKSVHI